MKLPLALSILICAVALAFSAVRENKYSRKREAAGAPGVPGAPSVEAQHVVRQTNPGRTGGSQ